MGYSLTGIKVVGNGNTMRNANVNDVMLNGIDVEGDRNVIEASVVVRSSIGDGIQLVGNGNTISDNTAGGASAGNGGHGISVSGQGNAVRRNAAYDNKGHGIDVSGGTAAWPNAVKANVAGAPGLGNFGNGITVTGRGNDGSAPVEIASNTAQNNYQNGFKVTGTAEQLRGNDAANNALCGYKVASGNLNGTGNLSAHVPIAGTDGSAFPIGCR